MQCLGLERRSICHSNDYPWVTDVIRKEISGADSIYVFQHRVCNNTSEGASLTYPLDALTLDARFRRWLPPDAAEAEARLKDPRTAAIELLEPATSVHVGG